MSLGAIKTKGRSDGLHKFVVWCVNHFHEFLDDESRVVVKQLIESWNITVRVVRRRSALWEQFAHHAPGSVVRGVTVLPAPFHPRYKQRKIAVLLEPKLLLRPPMLGAILMHELGHALRYAELQVIAKDEGYNEGMYLEHDAAEDDADNTMNMFVAGVARAADKEGMDAADYVRRAFCNFVSEDPELEAIVVEVQEAFDAAWPCDGPF